MGLSKIDSSSREAMAVSKSKDYLANETRIVLVGKTGAGKSATGNTVVGEDGAFKSDPSAKSVTQRCQQKMCSRFNHYLQVIDVPGFLDNRNPTEVEKRIVECFAMASPGIHAILFTVRIGRYTDEDVKTVEKFIEVFGKNSRDVVIVVFTGKDDLDHDGKTLDNFIENSPVSLKTFLREVKNRHIAVSNRDGKEGKEKFVEDLLTMIEQMLRDNGRSFYTNDAFQEAELPLKKAEEKQLEMILAKNKEKDQADIAEAKKLFLSKMEAEGIPEDRKQAQIVIKVEEVTHNININHQKDARETVRIETVNKINAGGLVVGATAGALTGAVVGVLLGPFGVIAGGAIGGIIGGIWGALS